MEGQAVKTNNKLTDDSVRIERFDGEEMPEELIDQLVAKSRQKHVLKHERHEDVGTGKKPGRFWDRESYKKWAAKGRTVYLMLRDVDGSDVPDVGGIVWFGERDCEQSPEYKYTFAIRNYGQYDPENYTDEEEMLKFEYSEELRKSWGQFVGMGYGTAFMVDTHSDFAQKAIPGAKIWLGVTEGNDVAVHLYKKVGYEEIATIPDPDVEGRMRIIMGYTG